MDEWWRTRGAVLRFGYMGTQANTGMCYRLVRIYHAKGVEVESTIRGALFGLL